MPTFQLAKYLAMHGLNLRPKSNFKVMNRFSSLANYRIVCNKVGVRLNYTNASCLIKYTQVGHKYKGGSDRPNDRKLKSRFQEKLGKHLNTLGSEVNSALPFLVECSRSISNSLDVDALLSKKNGQSNADYIKPIFPSVDDIQVKRLHEDGDATAIKYFNINSILSNSAVLLNVVTLPSSDIFSIVYKYNCSSNNLNRIDNRVQSPNSSNLNLERALCSPTSSPDGNVPSPQKDSQKGLGKPSEETLLKLSNTLSEEMRAFFTKSMNYQRYTQDVVFENRISGKVTVGLFPYIRQLSFLRILAHFKFAYVEVEILKVTQHPIDGTIRIRWRIVGVSALKSLPFLFTLRSYSMKSAKDKMDTWYDGFSTFYINQDGLIYKHVADKMMPDEEALVDKKPSIMSRLAVLMGRTMKTPASSQPAVTTSVADIPKDKEPSNVGRVGAQKSSLASIFVGCEILGSVN